MRLTRSWVVVAAAAILAVPLATSPSLASWTDQEWVHSDAVGTSELDCGTTPGFRTAASGRQVSGTLLGTNLDDVIAVDGVGNALDGTPTETWGPAGAYDLDGASTETYTRGNSLSVGALGGLLGVALPQITVGLPGFGVGTLAQYSQVTPTGRATGATGAVANQSNIATIGNYEGSNPPSNGSISLNQVLGSAITSALTDASLDIGAVSAISRIDGCDLLREATWDVPARPESASRDYDIAGLDLTLNAPALSTVVPTIESTVTTLQGQLNGLQGSLGSTLTSVLGNINLLGLVSLGGTSVTVSAIPDLHTVTSGVLDSFTDGVVTLSPRTGRITVDLEALLGGPNGLNDLDPNTLLTDADVLVSLGNRVNALLAAWQAKIIGDLTAATDAVHLKVEVALTAGLIVKLADVKLTIDADLGTIIRDPGTNTSLVGVSATLLGQNVTLTGQTLALVNTIVNSLLSTVRTAVANVFATITALDTSITAAITPLMTAVSAVFGVLAPILEIHVNVQPDQPGAPPATAYVPATRTATAEYRVTALRIGILDPLLPTSLNVATASAGPVSLP